MMSSHAMLYSVPYKGMMSLHIIHISNNAAADINTAMKICTLCLLDLGFQFLPVKIMADPS